jgi:hypothetical protein
MFGAKLFELVSTLSLPLISTRFGIDNEGSLSAGVILDQSLVFFLYRLQILIEDPPH